MTGACIVDSFESAFKNIFKRCSEGTTERVTEGTTQRVTEGTTQLSTERVTCTGHALSQDTVQYTAAKTFERKSLILALIKVSCYLQDHRKLRYCNISNK